MSRSIRFPLLALPTTNATALFLLIWPVLLSAPILLTGEPTRLLFIVLAVPFLALLFLANLSWPGIAVRSRAIMFGGLVLFTGVSIAAALRANPAMVPEGARLGLGATIALLFAMAALAFRPAGTASTAYRVSAFTYALPLYVAFNFALYLLLDPEWLGRPYQPRFPQSNQMLVLFGLETERVTQFGAIRGANTLGLMAGLSIVLLGCRLRWSKKIPWITLWLIVVNGFALLLAESRVALAIAAGCLILFHICGRRLAMGVAQGAVVFAFLSPLLMGGIYDWLSGFGPSFIRQAGQGQELGIGTGRPAMLDAGIDFLSRFDVQNIWGYGYYSHVASGASRPFEWMFEGDLARSSFHNAALQNIHDIGYAGAALYFALVWKALAILGRTKTLDSGLAKSLIVALLFIVLTGCTEVSGTIYHLEIFGLMIGLLGVAAAQPERNAANVWRSKTSSLPPSLALTTRPSKAA